MLANFVESLFNEKECKNVFNCSTDILSYKIKLLSA